MCDEPSIRLSIAAEGQSDRFVLVELSQDDRDLFLAYFAEYEQLTASKPMQGEIPCSLNFTAAPGKPPTFKASLPSKDDIAILLHRMRPFVLEKEKTSFHRVAKRVRRRVQDPAIHDAIAFAKTQWNGRHALSQIPVTVNQKAVVGVDLIEDWLYGHEYHRDADRQAATEQLRSSMPEPMFDFMVVNLFLDKVRATGNLAATLALLIGKLKELRFGKVTIKRVEAETATPQEAPDSE